jgi:phosphoribosylglycinamide formyltransferase 1
MANASNNPAQLVVLISGSGSNLQSIIDRIDAGQLNAQIAAVISNVPDVKGLERAANHQIPAIVLDHKSFADRDDFESALQDTIDQYQPDLVVLAGFMRILGANFTRHYRARMLNIHPSLLPKYPGLHTHKRALEAGDEYHGTSIHFVTEELDGGPLVAQRKFAIDVNDTVDSLFTKVQALEHELYPDVIAWFADKRLTFKNDKAFLDGEPINIPAAS